MIKNIQSKLDSIFISLQQAQGQKDILFKTLTEKQDKLTSVKNDLPQLQKIVQFLQNVSLILREKFISQVEQNVTKALQEVLNNPNIEFKVILETKGTKIFSDFKTVDKINGCEFSIVKGESGGIKNIIGTALLITFLEMFPELDGPLMLDEVGKNISKEYQENFGKFLREYSETGRQVILVSHLSGINKYAHNTIYLK